MIKAVIFDMDGVMIDSERLYREACAEIVGRYGGAITPELFEKQMGLKMEETQRVVVEIANLPLTPQETRSVSFFWHNLLSPICLSH
ncbi:MAG: HAD hydrolase-like protein, partial [Mesotoga sp.]|nr:HAD hydrolase-like protein [Mesotoga sp.]